VKEARLSSDTTMDVELTESQHQLMATVARFLERDSQPAS
jgi:hypothetical protein